MACPYFCPTRRLQAAQWRGRFRPPLGEIYEGECHARPGDVSRPSGELLIEGCNFGYAAGRCGRFPAADGPEAVRFCVREDAGGVVRLDYAVERAHLPHEHGRAVYDRALNGWTGLREGSLLERQARAYVESYLAWKDGGAPPSASSTAKGKGLAAGGKA